MIDIFRVFEIENKEDKYTFCLERMINEGGNDFRKIIAEKFNLTSEYSCKRESFSTRKSNLRKHITPDLVLISKEKVVVIESKMFSDEGFYQTEEYYREFKEQYRDGQIDFYYLTLSGKKAGNDNFKSLKWSEFYCEVLSPIVFEDECLELLRKTILNQAKKYEEYEAQKKSKSYNELFSDTTRYWVTPYAIMAAGNYDFEWSEGGKYEISNIVVRGNGHSEFVTDIFRHSWRIKNERYYFNPFIRIEWNIIDPVVWLCWEYSFADRENEYINPKKLNSKELSDSAIKAQMLYKEVWNYHGQLRVKVTAKREDSIKALKGIVDGNLILDEVIKTIKEYIHYYAEEIEMILGSSKIEDKLFVFVQKKYEELDALRTFID